MSLTPSGSDEVSQLLAFRIGDVSHTRRWADPLSRNDTAPAQIRTGHRGGDDDDLPVRGRAHPMTDTEVVVPDLTGWKYELADSESKADCPAGLSAKS